MGTQLDKDQSAKTIEYKSAIQDIGRLMLSRLTNVWLHNDFVFSLSATGKRYNECLLKVNEEYELFLLQSKTVQASVFQTLRFERNSGTILKNISPMESLSAYRLYSFLSNLRGWRSSSNCISRRKLWTQSYDNSFRKVALIHSIIVLLNF